MPKIKLLDTTLRDGEQTPGVSLTPSEKVKIANKLDEFGIDIIEAGTPITSEGEREGIKRIAAEKLEAEIITYSRILTKDIDEALSCDVDGIHLVAPASKLHIEEKLKKTSQQVLDMITECVDYAKKHGLVVELSAEDGSRAETSFLSKMAQLGEKLKAERYCVCDTVGVLTPEKTQKIYSTVAKKTKLPLAVHCHDDFGLAVANSLTAVQNGASEIHCTVNGLGERAGNAALEEIVIALELLYDKKLKVKTEIISELSQLVESLAGVRVAKNKAIVGENAFTHEAGIHVDGLLKSPKTYEPIPPALVGRKRMFVVGKHVGTKSVEAKLNELNIKPERDEVLEITKRIKALGDMGKKVSDLDLRSIAETVMGVEKERVINLKEVVTVSGNILTPTATVKVKVGEKEVLDCATGVGPVDAAINAIRRCVKSSFNVKLVDYTVEAITGGTDALVDVQITLTDGAQTIKTRGTGPDIIMASVEAMLDGINRLAGKTIRNGK